VDRDVLREFLRFVLTGLAGVVIGLGIYEATHRALPAFEFRPTVAWAVSYVIGIAIQHSMHRTIVFRNATISYWNSLWRTYAIYGVGTVLAAGLNLWLVYSTSWNHRVIWAVTTGFVSVLNYFALRLFTYRSPG
jgi:putative flippase GtrA